MFSSIGPSLPKLRKGSVLRSGFNQVDTLIVVTTLEPLQSDQRNFNSVCLLKHIMFYPARNCAPFSFQFLLTVLTQAAVQE